MNPLFLLLGFFGAGTYAAAAHSGSSSENLTRTLSDTDDRPTGAKGVKKPKKTNDEETPISEEPTPEEPVEPAPVVLEEPTPVEPVEPAPVVQEEPTPVEPVEPAPVVLEEPAPEEPVEPAPVVLEEPTPVEPVEPAPVVLEEPTPVEPVEPAPVVQEEPTPVEPVEPTPEAPVQSGGSGSDGGETTPTILDGTVEVMTGRVATLDPSGSDIVELKIISGVEHGNITVNPDNTFALVMTQTDFTGMQSFTYEATHTDGSTTTHEVSLDVAAGAQDAGWGTGEGHYMLATDADDRLVVEHGETHTKVYISGDNNALSLADIAAQENMSLSQVTGSFLAANGYGQSEDLALDQEAGMQLWNTVTPRASETSNWLLLERGYEYDDLGSRILTRDTHGEDENHPLYMGAWGEGDRPEITTELRQYQESSSNLVIQDIHFSGGFTFSHGENIILDGIMATGGEVAIQRTDGVTIRNSEFVDILEEESADGGDWDTHSDRIQGLYMNFNDGVLLEGLLFDHNSWADDYFADGSGEGGQAPSMFSHNMYLDADMTDLTLRDTITMRAASYGANVRSGGFVEDNLFLDNNAAINFVGGDYGGSGPVGQYTLMADNVITSGAHKVVDQHNGGLTLGINDRAQLTSLVDNIVAHLADPNNPDEQEEKYWTHTALRSINPYYDDTIVWNWEAQQDGGADTVTNQNTDGLDTAALDQTTIQLFTAQLLGDQNATIADLADYLRAQADGAFDDVVDADLIIRFFQEGFGIAPDIRDGDSTLRFIPDELGEGVRWDNRMNWDTDDLPGLYATDSVDLGGNHVTYGSNTEIDTLDFGPGGMLNVYGGRLELNGGFTGDDGGTLNIEGAGQVWSEGSDASDLQVNVSGGRFANTGEMQNADLTATGGETILATGGAEFDLAPSKTLAVFEAAAKVGFDGDDGGMAILDMHEGSTLAFEARDGDLGTIEEFRSGALGDDPDVLSGVDLGNATLSIDLTGLSAEAGTAFTLMDTDEIVGIFEDATVDGLGARDAKVVIDYENDSVQLQLSAGNGSVSVETLGDMTDTTSGEQALWDALTNGQGVASETAQVQELDEEDLLDAA